MSENRMQGKTALVTGATNGIGRVAARELAKMGAEVVIVGRNAARIEETLKEIRASAPGAQVEGMQADLSSMAEVRRLAEAFKARHQKLHVLVNNAGAVFAQRQVTADGFEMTFGLNHLSYFLLTHLLLDMLKQSAPARIVNVSSGAHQLGPMRFDDLQSEKGYGMAGFRAYSQSKLANVMFTYELARRLEGSGVTANVLHPGSVATGFGRNNNGLMAFFVRLTQRFSLTPEQGADTVIYLASSPEVEGVTGKYWEKRRAIQSSSASYDQEAQKRLWELSEQMVGLTTKVAS